MAWLGTWKYRQKITIDSTKIGSDLTHFPLTIILDSVNHPEIFSELGSTESLKLAITKDDGATQLYGEIEYWDANSIVIHASKSDLVISSSIDTELYLYFDSAQVDNSTYIGSYSSVVGQNVWNPNYKLVSHMGSSLTDSTSNGNNGTPTGTTLVSGNVGNAREFNGTSDLITIPHSVDLNIDVTESFMINVIFMSKETETTGNGKILNKRVIGDSTYYTIQTTSRINTGIEFNALSLTDTSLNVKNDGIFHLATLIGDRNVNTLKLFVDGTQKASVALSGSITNTSALYIGNLPGAEYFTGIIDELRVMKSTSPIDESWVTSEYESAYNNLLTFGTVEDSNSPPINITPPTVSGDKYTGFYVTPVFGTWNDIDGTITSVIRTWLIDSIPIAQNPDDGDLLLSQDWLNSTLVLREEAFDNLGASTIQDSIEYVITEPNQFRVWTTPIYDRTQNDVNLLKSLSEQIKLVGWDNATQDQRDQWLQISVGITKGALNALDLNRIDANILFLVDYLNDDYGLIADVDESNPYWTVSHIPLLSNLNRIRDNLQELIEASYTPIGLPTIAYSVNPNWEDINDIEETLQLLKTLLDRIPLGYKYCGSFNCGQTSAL